MSNLSMLPYKADIIKALGELVSIESVALRDRESHSLPFGQKSADALEFMRSLGEGLGLEAEICDNYACHVQLGEGGDSDYAAVLTHVDVVPAGDGWHSPPFCLTERDGYLYGRGVADDKGAAIVSLYCLKAMKDCGVKLKRPVRCIFGGGEEIGMDDMQYYFSRHSLPTVAFTPDADYPMCNCEKGILHLTLSADAAKTLPELSGGSAVNCVADSCRAVVICDDDTAEKIRSAIEELGLSCECEAKDADSYSFRVKGVSAHAMCPEKGKNAIDAFFIAANRCGIFGKDDAESFLSEKVCGHLNGAGCSLNFWDEVSGGLTMNVGTAEITGGRITVRIDIRYPATFGSSVITDKFSALCEDAGISMEIAMDNAPLYVEESHPLIQALSECYREVTGQSIRPISMGGGTYARTLGGRGVAFGPVFQDSAPPNLHMADENLSISDLMLHAEICLKAMCRLAELETA